MTQRDDDALVYLLTHAAELLDAKGYSMGGLLRRAAVRITELSAMAPDSASSCAGVVSALDDATTRGKRAHQPEPRSIRASTHSW